MSPVVLTSREFNQDTGRAKREARKGPVFISDRGRPGWVLLSLQDYERLQAPTTPITQLLAMPAADPVDFEPPRLRTPIAHPAELD